MVLPAADPEFSAHLARRAGAGIDCNVNLLGEAILGDDEARRAARRCLRCAATPGGALRVGEGELVVRQPRCACVRVLGRADCRAAPSGVAGCRGGPSAQARLPGHGGIPRPAPHARGIPQCPRRTRVPFSHGWCRAAVVSPRFDRRTRRRVCMGRGSSPVGRGDGAGADREGRESRNGAGRCRALGVAAGAVRDEGRGRRELQADARSCVRRRRAWRLVGRCRKPQSVRRRVGVDPARRAWSHRRGRDRDARRHGARPIPRRAGCCRRAPAVLPGRRRRGLRVGDCLSLAPSRRERRGGELPARGVHDHGGISELGGRAREVRSRCRRAPVRLHRAPPRSGPSDRSTPIRPGG